MNQIPIFFDLGGTIIDNIEIGRKAFNKVFNKNFTTVEIKAMFNDMSKKMTVKSLFKIPINPIKMITKRKEFSRLQNQYILSEGKLFQGTKEFLLKLKSKREIVLVIVTQNPQFKNQEFVDKLFNRLFEGKHPFDYVLSNRNKMGIIKEYFESDDISKALFIGDLPNDMNIAKELQIPGVGVAWGYAAGKLDTPFIVESFDELYDLIEEHLQSLKAKGVGLLQRNVKKVRS